MGRPKATPASDAKRFWSYVRKTKKCWHWVGGLHANGYGQFWLSSRGQSVGAHVYSFTLKHGEPKHSVLHSCNGPRHCVNPAHLYDGNDKDNARDRDTHGKTVRGTRWYAVHEEHTEQQRGDKHWSRRMPERLARGEKAGPAKLTEKKVKQLRALYADGWTLSAVADKFGITKSSAHAIVRRKSWSHVA